MSQNLQQLPIKATVADFAIVQNELFRTTVGRNRKIHYFCGDNVSYGISSYGNADKLARNNSWYNAISGNVKN